MKIFIVSVLFLVTLYTCEGQENYLKSPFYPCVRCLCHARSGCWIRQNCAKYSIDKNYWRTAGSLVVNGGGKPDDDESDDEGYRKCMSDENCIVGTIINYTRRSPMLDCNCDEKFDCKDMAAIHIFGRKCQSPKFGRTYARRFNECASRVNVTEMLAEEGDDLCTAPEVEVF